MNKKLIILFLVLLPLLVVYRSFFSQVPLVWGDAPFFYKGTFDQLLREPQAWVHRGANGGAVNQILWIEPLMKIYGVLGVIGLSNDLIIRILFYFPSIVGGFIGAYYFCKDLKISYEGSVLGAFFYTCNTYLLLLVDGGQVGVLLAYGIFPWFVLQFRRLFEFWSISTFSCVLLTSLLLMIADPRILIIAFSLVFLWTILDMLISKKTEVSKILILLLVFILTFGIGIYWLYPFFTIQSSDIGGMGSQLNTQFLSLLHGLFLYQPHWPQNIFGRITQPSWIFALLPITFFIGLAKSKSKLPFGLFILFLLYVFLSKGTNAPLGQIYEYFIKMPGGVAFRDSSKFFIPLLLIASYLIGNTVTKAKSFIVWGSLYSLLLLTVYPSIIGNMQFNLSSRKPDSEIIDISNNFQLVDGDKKVAWVPERNPYSIHYTNNQAFDGKSLVQMRPFAARNAGSYDNFNFLHSDLSFDFLRLIGITNIVLSDNPRIVTKNEQETRDWNDLNERIATISGKLKKISEDKPVFEILNPYPKFYSTQKLAVIVGSDNIFEKIRNIDSSFEIGNVAFSFVEDGIFSISHLPKIDPESIWLIFNDSTELDLHASLLKNRFISMNSSDKREWSVFSSNEYLEYKFQLLIREIKYEEFDYNMGIAMSTKEDEAISFKSPISNEEVIIAVRALSGSKSNGLKIYIDENEIGEFMTSTKYGWFMKKVKLDRDSNLVIKNQGGVQVLNVVAIVPESEWVNSQKLTSDYMNSFKSMSISDLSRSIGQLEWKPVDYVQIEEGDYKVNLDNDYPWLVFMDKYNSNWLFKTSGSQVNSVAAYSLGNVFYTKGNLSGQIYFKGQDNVRKGIQYSYLIIILIVIVIPSTYYIKKSYDGKIKRLS